MKPWTATLLCALWGMYPFSISHRLHLFNLFKYVLMEFNQLLNSLMKGIKLPDQNLHF